MRGGLGRGLSSLIPTAETIEHAELSHYEQVLHSLINSGLDQIDRVASCDLLAYAHLPLHDEPSLVLRKPAIANLSSMRAFRLFSRVDRAITSEAEQGSFTVDGTAVVFTRTAGTRSAGVHFVGRAGTVLDRRALTLIRAISRSFATICNQYEAGVPEDLPTPRLVVEIEGGETGVEATITGPGGAPSTARAAAAEAIEAVARAVLEAYGSELSFRDAREIPINGSRAVLVMLTDHRGVPHPGFVMSDDDLLQATAAATLRAIDRR